MTKINFQRILNFLFLIAFLLFGACAGPQRFVRKAPAPEDMPKHGVFVNPLPGSHVISNFGPRGREFHEGIDLKKSKKGGDFVIAARAGMVKFAKKQSGYGRMVLIRHKDGCYTRYAHLKKIFVEEGQTVAAGEKIGTVGSSGRATTPHLHFEIITRTGCPVNARPYLK
ncbi:MAG: M23 family metallopeptidase [Elusimicrobia bacterium]|nr:M23 family metallopeptidase [Elusimicrobiota bacterium]